MDFVDLARQLFPGSPQLAAITAVILGAAAWIGIRTWRSMRRQGARVGTLERRLHSERNRRRQVEQCLREQGIRLPYNPDDPAELYTAYNAGRWQDDDRDDDRDDDESGGTTHLETQHFVSPRRNP